jgi:hypothetical protein
VRQRTPEPHFYFEEWLDAHQFPPPSTTLEQDLQIEFVIGLRVAWEDGFRAGFMAKERYDGHSLPHKPKEKNDA